MSGSAMSVFVGFVIALVILSAIALLVGMP